MAVDFASVVFQVEKPKPIKCGTFGATSLQQRHMATGDFDGNLNIWYFLLMCVAGGTRW